MPEENQNQNQSQSVSPVNADGSFTPDWTNQFDESDRATLERFTSTGFKSLGTSYVELQRKFRKDPDSLVEIPNESSSDEVRAAFHKARGVPDTAEDYKYERSAELSENVDVNSDRIAAFSQIAKKWDLTPEQFNGISNDYLALISKDITRSDIAEDERYEQEREKGVATLKKYLGNALEERTLRAEAIMRKYGNRIVKDAKGNELNILEELYKELPDIEKSPWIRMLLDNIAEDMSEDRIKGLTSITTSTPSDIKDKIAELRAHEAYMDATHPLHQSIQEQITELYKKRAG